MTPLQQFLTELSAHNDRPWFAAHRAQYDAVREQWYADLDRLLAACAEWEPVAARLDGRTASYRIYRDTRFSPDKTPYKTYFSARIEPRLPGGQRAAGWYIHAGIPGDYSGIFGGIWAPDSAQLRKLRHAIVDNIEEFEDILNAPELRRLYPEWWGDRLKTIPKGWPRDHAQAPLLRLLNYGRDHEVEPRFFADPDWPLRAAEIMRPLKPMIDFLNYSLTEEV